MKILGISETANFSGVVPDKVGITQSIMNLSSDFGRRKANRVENFKARNPRQNIIQLIIFDAFNEQVDEFHAVIINLNIAESQSNAVDF